MLNRMLISGQVGVLAVQQGESTEVFRADGTRVANVNLNDLGRLFSRAGDVVEEPQIDFANGLKILSREKAKGSALLFVLMVLDEEEEEEIAGRAAERLNTLLGERDVLEYIENQMYSAPLPKDSPAARIERLMARKQTSASFWSNLILNQELIARTRLAFDSALEKLGYPQSQTADYFETAVDAGAFRCLVKDRGGSPREVFSGLRKVIPSALVNEWRTQVLAQALPPSLPAPQQQVRKFASGRASLVLSPVPMPPVTGGVAVAHGLALRAPAFGGGRLEIAHGSSIGRSSDAPVIGIHQLIEAGAHFGHQIHRWNPRMKPYIFGERNGIHILDLSQTVPLFARALAFVSATVAAGGKVLFVGSKRQAQEPIADAARRAGQHFINQRWLGGMLTNWKTISASINRLKTIEKKLSGDTHGLTKKEVLQMMRERDKLALTLGGIRDMNGIPDVMFVIDAKREELAIKEANTLGVPVVAILDSNVSPDGIAFPVPANDDAIRAIRLYCDAIAQAAMRGRVETLSSDYAVVETEDWLTEAAHDTFEA